MCLVLIAALRTILLLWSPFYRWGNKGLEMLSKSCSPWNKGAWQATVHGVARVWHNLATKPPPPQNNHIEFEPKSLWPYTLDSICLVAMSSKHITRLSWLGFGDMHFIGFLPTFLCGLLCGSSSPCGVFNAWSLRVCLDQNLLVFLAILSPKQSHLALWT